NAATDSYYAQVRVNPGIVSDPAPLLFAPDTDISTEFDGVTLSVSWTPPASQIAAAATQILLQTPAGTQAVVSADSGFGQMIVSPKLRHSGDDWLVYLTPRLEISSGPTSAPVSVMHTAPAVVAVTVFGAETTMGALTKVNLGLVIMVP